MLWISPLQSADLSGDMRTGSHQEKAREALNEGSTAGRLLMSATTTNATDLSNVNLPRRHPGKTAGPESRRTSAPNNMAWPHTAPGLRPRRSSGGDPIYDGTVLQTG